MIIFIRGISERTKKSDLAAFVSTTLTNRLRLISGKVIKSEVLILQDKRTKLLEFHGLVHVDSVRAGQYAITKLNGTLFQGKRVVVREYIERSWKNDRRENHAAIVDPIGKGNRRGDRRRQMEVMKSISHMFTSRKNAARKLV